MRTLRLVFVVAAIFCFISSIAFAQEMEGKGACRTDVEKFCKDVQPGQGRIAQCMKQHEAELSPACKERIAKGKERIAEGKGKEKAQAIITACKPDMEKFCKGVEQGQGRIIRCLKANEAQLSPECREQFKK